MAWRRPGDKPLSEAMVVSLLTHICVTRPQWVKIQIKLLTLLFIVNICNWGWQVDWYHVMSALGQFYVAIWCGNCLLKCHQLAISLLHPCDKSDYTIFGQISLAFVGVLRILILLCHDDVIKWKLFPRYWPLCGDFFYVGSPHKLLKTVEWQVIWDNMTFLWRHCYGDKVCPGENDQFSIFLKWHHLIWSESM